MKNNKDQQLMHEKLSFSEVSGFTTTTSSHVKPLGASSYWKPVALTKNPTVVAVFSALGALVTDELHNVRLLTPRWQNTRGLLHILAAPSDSTLLETSHFLTVNHRLG